MYLREKYNITSSDTTIIKNVVFSAIKQLPFLDKELFDDNTYEIEYYFNRTKATKTTKKLKTIGTNIVKIRVLEKNNSDPSQHSNHNNVTGDILFCDEKIGFVLSRSISNKELEIDIDIITKNEDMVNSIHDYLTSLMETDNKTMFVDLNFNYLLPGIFSEISKEIFSKRSSVAPYKDTYWDYINNNKSDALTVTTNATGSNSEFTMAERHANTLLYLDLSEEVEKPEYNLEEGFNTIKFKAILKHNKPTNIFLNAPLFVHQQYLDEVYLDRYSENLKKLKLEKQNAYNSQGSIYPDILDLGTQHIDETISLVNIPDYDEHTLMNQDPHLINLVSCLVSVNEDKYLFNIKNDLLHELTIDKDLADYLTNPENANLLTSKGNSFLHIYLTKGEYGFDSSHLELTSDGDLKLCHNVDLREISRIKIGLNKRLDLLSGVGKNNLIKNSKLFKKLITNLYPELEELEVIKKLNKNVVSIGDITNIIKTVGSLTNNIKSSLVIIGNTD